MAHQHPSRPRQECRGLIAYHETGRVLFVTSPRRLRCSSHTVVHDYWSRPESAETWVATVPGRGFLAIIRLYGPDQPYFDETWKPDDVVKVE